MLTPASDGGKVTETALTLGSKHTRITASVLALLLLESLKLPLSDVETVEQLGPLLLREREG